MELQNTVWLKCKRYLFHGANIKYCFFLIMAKYYIGRLERREASVAGAE